ncbi:MAG: DUF2570 domain-containing protein [Lachnospiraceae bacterium]|nr:DUF2570 domain-containing protein [Lachnospiraceae bacterium]
MTRKGLANKNVISAITIALSATMAMAPVASLAQEVVDPELANNTVTETTEAGQATEEAATETGTADAQADTAQEAAETAADAVETLVEDVLEGDNAASSDDGGNAAADSISDFAAAAQDLADDKTLRAAADSLADANDSIDDAEEANRAIADALSDGGTDVSIANDIANATEASVDRANEDVDNILASVQDSNATPDQVKDAVDQVDKIYDQVQKDVQAAKQTVSDLSNQYDTAKAALAEAEKIFNESVGQAGADVQSAKLNLETAQQKVDNLETALVDAQEELDAENKAAMAIRAADDLVKAEKKPTWGKQTKFMENYMMYYYIYQMIDPDAKDISVKLDKGFNGQESSRFVVKYARSDGAKETQYFNYDRTDRTYSDEDMWADLGSSKDLVIYEKSAEEIEADQYIASYCKNNNITLGDKNESAKHVGSFRYRVNQGEFDVFAYEDNGVTKYIARDEINNGSSGRKVEEIDGVYYINDNPAHKVNYTTAKTATVKMDVASDTEFQDFLSNAQAYVDKYNSYTAATEAAKGAVETAQTEVDTLSDAITELQDNHSSRLAKDVLGVEDVASYFELNNITADEAGMLNKMTVDEVVRFFDELLQKAKDKVDSAELKLQDLQTKLTEAESELDEIMSHISPDVVMELLDSADDEQIFDEYAAADSTDETSADTVAAAASAATGTGTAPAGNTAQTAPGAAQAGGFAAAVDATNPTANAADGVLGLNRAEEGDVSIEATNEEALAETLAVNKLTAASQDKSGQNLVTINDGQTALAGELPGADAQAMSWWWVIVVALLGETGRRMYKEHMEKKEALKKIKSEDK